VIGGSTFVTEPAHGQHTVGSIIFVVVVVGGMGSLAGAFLASILIGVIQTFAIAVDASLIGPGRTARHQAQRGARLQLADEAHCVAGGADPAVPAPGADPDLPAQGSARHAGGS
jgi:ABC-type branched-subunit amino acid transport system permease subunit